MERILLLSALDGVEEVLNLASSPNAHRLFSKAVVESIQDDVVLAEIGQHFISLLESEMHLGLFKQPVELSLPLLVTLLRQDLGENSAGSYDPLTKIITLESPVGKKVRESVWYSALTGFLRRTGLTLKQFENVPFQEETGRIVQSRIKSEADLEVTAPSAQLIPQTSS